MSAGLAKARYILRDDHEFDGEIVLRRGDVVELFSGQDFGVVNADIRRTGIRHICVTLIDGNGEFLSVPFGKLKRV
jgi:hypothetical protein